MYPVYPSNMALPEQVSNALNAAGQLQDVLKVIAKNDHGNSVMHVLSLMRTLNILPIIGPQTKSKTKSTTLQEQGKKHFQSSQYEAALQYYNLALLYAPKQSTEMKLAFDKRSELFFKIKKYNACIKDIEIALSMGVLEESLPKLIERQNTCLLKQTPSVSKQEAIFIDSLKMTDSPNEYIPCASSAVKITMNENERAVVAAYCINDGQVIAVEKPFVNDLNVRHRTLCCYRCLKFTDNLIPCDSCCTTMFCDENCRKKSWKEGHQVECNMMNFFIELCGDFCLSLKALIKARKDSSSWEELMERVRAANLVYGVHRGFVENKSKQVELDSKHYESICTQPLEDTLKIGTVFNMTVLAAVAVHAMSDFMADAKKKKKKDIIKFVGNQLVLHATGGNYKYIPASMSPLSVENQKKFPNKAIGYFVFAGLLANSCSPNVRCYSVDDKMVLMAKKPINVGSEVFM